MRDLVIGFDGASSAGWAVLDLGENVISSGAWDVGRDADSQLAGDRWMLLDQEISELLDTHRGRVGAVAIERPSNVQWASSRVLFGQSAIVEMAAARRVIESVLVSPSSIKKITTGNGRATKREVQAAMRKLAPLRASTPKGREDESDARGAALWLLRTHCHRALAAGDLVRV